MKNQITVSFRVRDKGGESGGKVLMRYVPAFDLTEFMKIPNAGEFVKKAYFAAVKRIIREVEEKTNGTLESDLGSIEAIVTRSLTYTKEEISEWIASRDWTKAKGIKNLEKTLANIKKNLPLLARRENHYSKEESEVVADKIIAAVADNPDPVADYIFSALTLPQSQGDIDWAKELGF